MARVFILGAGASRFARYPLGTELYGFVKECRSCDSTTNHAAEIAFPVIDKLIAESSENAAELDLERLFTKKDLECQGERKLFPRRDDWNGAKSSLISIIAGAFLLHESKIQGELAGGTYIVEVLKKWAAFLREGDTIVTFNWDVLHEAALWRSGKWHYADGYGFISSDAPSELSPSQVKVLKLHGSINWAQEDKRDREPSIEYKQLLFSGATDAAGTYLKSTAQPNAGKNLIIPSYLKDFTEIPLFVHIWNQAADALAAATEVFAIGYSLQPADAQARFLIASALLRNKNDFRLQVVSPGADHWNDFCSSIERKRQRIPKTFEDWIMNPSRTNRQWSYHFT